MGWAGRWVELLPGRLILSRAGISASPLLLLLTASQGGKDPGWVAQEGSILRGSGTGREEGTAERSSQEWWEWEGRGTKGLRDSGSEKGQELSAPAA